MLQIPISVLGHTGTVLNQQTKPYPHELTEKEAGVEGGRQRPKNVPATRGRPQLSWDMRAPVEALCSFSEVLQMGNPRAVWKEKSSKILEPVRLGLSLDLALQCASDL